MGRDFIAPRVRWVVGDGKKIKIREDRWLPIGILGRPPNRVDLVMVEELINESQKEWDIPKLESLFDEKIMQEIMALPLSSYLPPQKLWNKLWKLQSSPKIKLFIWSACQNALPTVKNLWKRKIQPNPICPMCKQYPETIKHLLLLMRVVNATKINPYPT